MTIKTYSQRQKSTYDCPFPYEMAFFQEGVVERNNAAMPLSFRIQIKLDQTFKVRYSMSQNYHWIQKYQPSKLKFRKKVRL